MSKAAVGRGLRLPAPAERQKANVAAHQADEAHSGAEAGAPQSRKTYPASEQQQHACALGEVLGMFGVSAAVLGSRGEVLFANRLFVKLVPNLVRELRGRPRLADPFADRLIATTLAQGNFDGRAAVRVVPIRGNQSKPSAVAQLISLRRVAGLGLDGGAHSILVVTPVRPRPAPNPMILQQLFGLSPAEARVASGLAGRHTIATMASDFGVSRETVRSQIKTALGKTGTKRQLDLAVLLASLQFPAAAYHPFG